MKNNKNQLVIFGSNVSTAIKDAFTASGLFAATVTTSAGRFVSDEAYTELFPKQLQNFDANTRLLKNADVVVVQSTGAPVGDSLTELLMLAHTLKHYGVDTVTAILPFAAFARQDRTFPNRFASVAADLLPRLVHASGIDRVLTVTPHSKAAIEFWQDEFQGNFKVLTTTQMFADDIRATLGINPSTLSIGAPDGANKPTDEGQSRAHELCTAVFNEAAADASKMFRISKEHTGVNQTKVTGFDGDVTGKDCVIVDDMVDGGSTIINAAALLKEKGARSVTAYLTHAILSPTEETPALERILIGTQVDKLVLTDTMTDALAKIDNLDPDIKARIKVLSVGGMLVAELQKKPAAPTNTPKPKTP